MVEDKSNTKKMPTLFLGHGSPMNAIENNDFTQSLQKLGKSLPRPKAILMVSAHWETNGTWVTGMGKPKTIHDFYGFPKDLYEVQYQALGAPKLADKVSKKIVKPVPEVMSKVSNAIPGSTLEIKVKRKEETLVLPLVVGELEFGTGR